MKDFRKLRIYMFDEEIYVIYLLFINLIIMEYLLIVRCWVM